MVHSESTYVGDLRCTVRHGPSGTVIETDAPSDNQGKGARFSPTDLVAAALGTCMLTTMGIIAAREKVDLVGSTVAMTKEMTTTGPRKIARLGVTFNLVSDATEDQRRKLELAAKTCPVHRSLNASVVVDVSFAWQPK